MKKAYYALTSIYIFLVIGFLLYYLFNLFGLDWAFIVGDLERIEKFVFFMCVVTLSLACLIFLLIKTLRYLLFSQVQTNLQSILSGKSLKSFDVSDVDQSFQELREKYQTLAENVQKSENKALQLEEVIVEKERKRIARDLHDTVSQELFAATMILSGVKGQAGKISQEQLGLQLDSVAGLLDTAQKDLRILLLHLRPMELEGRSLVAGLELILKELTDKSEIEVHFKHRVEEIPKQVEEHIFRIAQEIISNTLRHANASRLDVYLYQMDQELQLKMVDDGIGFEQGKTDELSYGLKNIEERVQDMAGELQLLTAPKQGVSIAIRVPLWKGKNHEDFID
ncbi:sensor histidine kinase [Streptococcus himalayensis]|uniref:Sensor histidine kinase n=1 Tax=Streptococcus himalayensis TaxID=1888195 RepID=A0A917EEI0_9STRE|nr:sensor histidine kinase [Streptococcus himalayensis]GGE28831.1 sensor histidine kinase [Streptococcus himalayensis]